MIGTPPAYNERSWAIDLIGHIKNKAFQENKSIKDAGGEQTVLHLQMEVKLHSQGSGK